jgi:elongation factor Ts
MAQITPQLVKELREKTGAGMGDCKVALTESDGDMKAAIEILRKKGAASAAKRADRSANEGIISSKTTSDGKSAVIVELNCETDFVARNAEFENYANMVSGALINNGATTLEELMNTMVDGDTVLGLHNSILAKFSEKIEVRRFDWIKTEGFISNYIHAGSKLAVLLEVSLPDPSEKAKTLIRDIAMQVAAMKPLFVSRTEVSPDQIAKELEIYKELALTEGKKPEMVDRIAQGKLEKYYQEQCLDEQAFVKDPSKVIRDVIREISEEAGKEVKVIKFIRYFLGESLD